LPSLNENELLELVADMVPKGAATVHLFENYDKVSEEGRREEREGRKAERRRWKV
jgi:hypothetical protein